MSIRTLGNPFRNLRRPSHQRQTRQQRQPSSQSRSVNSSARSRILGLVIWSLALPTEPGRFGIASRGIFFELPSPSFVTNAKLTFQLADGRPQVRRGIAKEEAIGCPPLPSPCSLLGGKINRILYNIRHRNNTFELALRPYWNIVDVDYYVGIFRKIDASAIHSLNIS
jgi:hypothetical protein